LYTKQSGKSYRAQFMPWILWYVKLPKKDEKNIFRLKPSVIDIHDPMLGHVLDGWERTLILEHIRNYKKYPAIHNAIAISHVKFGSDKYT
jgi:hypothetical protein